MPPRFAYWTIIIDDAPTAFRARDRAELAGVFRQLSNRNPNAVMKWFAHGKLWDSPEQERTAAREAARAERERRGPDWRPGGKHEDPRARFDKRRPKPTRDRETGREDGGRPGGAGSRREERPRGARPASLQRKPPTDRPDAKPGARDRGRWERGRDPRAGKSTGRRDWARPRFPRGAGRSAHGSSDKPGEPEPQAPPQPPSAERPPKPGQEPVPDIPAEETIRILPEPPERARPKRR